MLLSGLAAAALLLGGAGVGLLLPSGEVGERPTEPRPVQRAAARPDVRAEILPFPAAAVVKVEPALAAAQPPAQPVPVERIPAPAVQVAGAADIAPEPAAVVLPPVVAERSVETPAGVRPLVWLLASADKSRRYQGAHLVGRFGSAAWSAAPTLDYTLRADPDNAVANEAAAALARIGRSGVPYLTAALAHESAAVRQRAAAALAVIGPEARAAVPALLQALADKSRGVRSAAARALGEVGGEPRLVAPALCQALTDPAAEVGKQAGLALASIGERAVPALRKTLQWQDVRSRRDAAQALAMIGPAAKEAAEELALLLQDGEPQVRAAAAGALAAIGKEGGRAIPALLKLLGTEKRFEVQQQTFQAITLIGSKDMPGLLKALREINDVSRWATPYLLRQFGPKAKDAVPHLITQLGDRDPGNRLVAALALGEIGADARGAAAALLKALEDPSAEVRVGAAAALARLDPTREALAKEQFALAFTKAEQSLDTARQTLQSSGLLRDPASDALLFQPVNWQALMNPAVQAQYNQIVNLLLLRSAYRPASPMFFKGFQQNNQSQLRAGIDQVLSQFGPEAVPAIVRGINLAAIYNLGHC